MCDKECSATARKAWMHQGIIPRDQMPLGVRREKHVHDFLDVVLVRGSEFTCVDCNKMENRGARQRWVMSAGELAPGAISAREAGAQPPAAHGIRSDEEIDPRIRDSFGVIVSLPGRELRPRLATVERQPCFLGEKASVIGRGEQGAAWLTFFAR